MDAVLAATTRPSRPSADRSSDVSNWSRSASTAAIAVGVGDRHRVDGLEPGEGSAVHRTDASRTSQSDPHEYSFANLPRPWSIRALEGHRIDEPMPRPPSCTTPVM